MNPKQGLRPVAELDLDLDATEDDIEFVDPTDADNAELQAAADRITGAVSTPPPTIPDPHSGVVELPAGFRRVKTTATGTDFEVVRTATIRELDGADEEAIAKANTPGNRPAWILTILERGVARLGDQAPSKDDLTALTFGDRDFLVLEIARATYGDEIPYRGFTCTFCGETFDVDINLGEDVPIKRLGSWEESEFEVELRSGKKLQVTLPTCEVEPEMDKVTTAAETNSILIANAVAQFHGDVEEARRLKSRDRATLMEEIAERMPGPQYNDVKFKHEPGCGEEVRLSINVTDLFLGM